MSVDADVTPQDAQAAPQRGPRPWTPEAAMEPLPPLAPPPRQPRARVTVVDETPGAGLRVLALRAVIAAAVLAAIVVLLLVSGH